MANENMGDIVIDRLHARADLLKARLVERYKRTNPLRMEKVRIPNPNPAQEVK